MRLFVGHDDFAFELVSLANDFVNRRKFDKTVFDVLYAYHGRGYGCLTSLLSNAKSQSIISQSMSLRFLQ